jgi:surfeit locus 1 family protein
VKRSTLLFLLISLVFAGICARLGFWQLSRRQQRLASNARIEGRITKAPVPVARVDRDTASSRFSRAIVSGAPDYDHEILLTYRGNDGAPGVDILTPVRVPGLDSAVLVNRGWVYSPDASTIERPLWRDTVTTWMGYVDTFEPQGDSVRDGRIKRTNYAAISRALPYPILPFYVVALGDSGANPSNVPHIVRLGSPKLDEGPHLNYAFQWFGFAIIALVGGGIVAARSMQSRLSS